MKDDVRERVLRYLEWGEEDEKRLTGQHCGNPLRYVTLENKELAIKIRVGYYRSVVKNKALALELIHKAVDEITGETIKQVSDAYDADNKVCTNCGCIGLTKTYDGYWCKMCKTEI